MYILYTDKQEDFKCKIGVEGTDISKTKARLVVEGVDISYLFEGKITSDGDCIIPIKKLKNVLNEHDSGKMKLEVVAEDTFFSPWEDDFIIKTNKKITVEVIQNNKEPLKEERIGVSVQVAKKEIELGSNSIITPIKDSEIKNNNHSQLNEDLDHGKEISKILINKGINATNIDKNINIVKEVIIEYINKSGVKLNSNMLIEGIVSKIHL